MVARLVIAGTGSGVGKTSAMVGLSQALRAQGLKVAAFKCGPDYLDPTYHALATGAPCHNLDGWLMGREAVLATFARASAGADIALIEGVMGLFDGASPLGESGSAAEIAKWLAAPVLLVVDASGMARSIAAVAQGFRDFDPALAVAGVIANRVGSASHKEILAKALGGMPLVGAFPKSPELAFPERHLGLVAALRGGASGEQLARWGALATEWCDLGQLLALARGAPPLPQVAKGQMLREGPPVCRIGIARDAAFDFYYEENLRLLEAAGAQLVAFSPLTDEQLPAVDGLYFGGGYPELHAPTLAANTAMRAAVHAFGSRGGPIYAECGGLMYLAETLQTLAGEAYPMVGLVPGKVTMQGRLAALGYVEVETTMPTLFGEAGLRFRGHQFRYSELDATPRPTAYAVHRRREARTLAEGYARQRVLGSYVHAHWASNPLLAAGFVATCRAAAEGRL